LSHHARLKFRCCVRDLGNRSIAVASVVPLFFPLFRILIQNVNIFSATEEQSYNVEFGILTYS